MALMLASLTLVPGGLIAWILVGLISGWLAGQFMKGGGYGAIGDILVGLVGSMVGGFLISLLDTGIAGFWGSIFVSFLGACVFIAISRALTGRRAT